MQSNCPNHLRWPPITKRDVYEVVNLMRNKDISIKDGSGIIAEFESDFRVWLGIKYCLAQNNGTSTLHSAFFAMGVKDGDEVIVPSFTWHSSVSPLLHLRAVPVFCEIDPSTLTIDPEDIERHITLKTKAILVVHLFGMPADMDRIMAIARKYALLVVEDCSHAYGSLYKGKRVGTFGDISCFSMQASKMLPAGEAGIFCTNKKEYYEKALLLGHFGRLHELSNEDYKIFANTGIGFKYRPHPLAIAIAKSQLRTIDWRIRNTNKNINQFERLLKNIPGISIIKNPAYCDFKSNYGFRFIYDADKIGISKTDFIKTLRKSGIPANDECYTLLHKEPIFQNSKFFHLPHNDFSLPITEKIHSKIISITLPYKPQPNLVRHYYETIRNVISKKIAYRQLSDGRSIFRKPDQMTIELTMGCNLQCPMCYQRDFRRMYDSSDEISAESIERLFIEVMPKSVTLSGGEPTTKKDFFRILDILKKLGIRFILLTNGSLFDEQFINKIKEYRGLGHISFSLDYYNEARHDSWRGRAGIFRRIMNAVDKLENHFTLCITAVVLEDNLNDLIKLIEDYSSRNVSVSLLPYEHYLESEIFETKKRLSAIFEKEADSFSLIVTAKHMDYEKMNQNQEILHTKQDKIDNASFHSHDFPNAINRFYIPEKVKGICRNLLDSRLRVDSKGNIIVCRIIREIIGHLGSQSAMEIWNSKKYKLLRQDYIKNGPFPICKRCPHFIRK